MAAGGPLALSGHCVLQMYVPYFHLMVLFLAYLRPEHELCAKCGQELTVTVGYKRSQAFYPEFW